MFSEFEIKRLITHLERRWKEISLIEDEDHRDGEKIRFLDKMEEVIIKINLILHHQDDPFARNEEGI